MVLKSLLVIVSKYAQIATASVKPFTDYFDYKPTNYLVADGTYIKIKSVWIGYNKLDNKNKVM